MTIALFIAGLLCGFGSAFCFMGARNSTSTVYNQVDLLNFGLAHDTMLAIAIVLGVAAAIFLAAGAVIGAIQSRDAE